MNRIINFTIADTNWAEIPLGDGTIQAMAVQARSAVDILVDYHPGAHTVYWTVKAGTVKSISWNTPHAPRLFVQTASVGAVIEIETASSP